MEVTGLGGLQHLKPVSVSGASNLKEAEGPVSCEPAGMCPKKTEETMCEPASICPQKVGGGAKEQLYTGI
jgi:hypothetical protein